MLPSVLRLGILPPSIFRRRSRIPVSGHSMGHSTDPSMRPAKTRQENTPWGSQCFNSAKRLAVSALSASVLTGVMTGVPRGVSPIPDREIFEVAADNPNTVNCASAEERHFDAAVRLGHERSGQHGGCRQACHDDECGAEVRV